MRRLGDALLPTYSPRDAVDAVRNVALFGGWGALWVATTRDLNLRGAARLAVISGLLLSAAVELTQSLIPVRTPSVLDVVTNTTGALLGAALIVSLVEVLRTRRGSKSFLGIPAGAILVGYLAAVLLDAGFAPFRLDPFPGLSGGPFTRMRATFAQFEWASLFHIPWGDMLLMLPLGVFAVASLVELGWPYRNAVRLVVASSGILMIGAELMHPPLGIPLQLGAILGHVVAVALGSWLGARFLPAFSREVRGRDRPLLYYPAYSVLVLLWTWRPYEVRPDFGAIAAQLDWARWIPLQAQAPRVDLFGVADITQGFFLYLPLGALLAVWPWRARGALGTFLPAVYLALLAELGQTLIVGRFFDVTDILVAVAGAAIGWTVVRHAGFRPYGEVLPARHA